MYSFPTINKKKKNISKINLKRIPNPSYWLYDHASLQLVELVFIYGNYCKRNYLSIYLFGVNVKCYLIYFYEHKFSLLVQI
jgi:hypothetical protein